jgi:peroxiredoxin Q/BCP
MTAKLKEGDKAPDFTLPSQDGREVSLHDYLGEKNVVLYFYPKDYSAGCTTETRAFSENYDRILSMDAEVIGVSSDSPESHKGFASKCGVKFPLASDGGGRVRDRYGVSSSMGFIPGRVTFVIDRQGTVRRVFASQLNPKRHVDVALDTLKTFN